MPTPITTGDPIFAGIAGSVPSAFLGDVVGLIDRSPILEAQINQLDAIPLADGGTARIALQTGAGNGANSSFHSEVINIGALSSYDDMQVIAAGGSTTPGQTELVTPAGVFTGLLAYEMAHWTDTQLGPIYSGAIGSYTIEQAVATEFASEGKSGENQYLVMSQIQQSEVVLPLPAGLANGNVLFNITSMPSHDTQLLQQVTVLQGGAQPDADSVSYLGSQFWNVPVDGGTFLSTMWNGYEAGGARDDLGITLSQITGYGVTESEAGTLAGCTIQTVSDGRALTWQIACPIPGQQQAQVSDSATQTVLAEIDSVIDPAGQLHLAIAASNFAFAAPAGASLSVTGSGDSITGASGNIIAVAGDNESVCLVSGAAGSATTTVFGGGSDVHDTAGGVLVMGTGAATVSGGLSSTIFGGTGGVVYQGGQEYADVIGGGGSCTIDAGAGGGWYGGGSLGANSLVATGAGTVLDAGGVGDTLTGAAGGGAWLIAASGNETLIGANQTGETTFFLGSGADLVRAGVGGSVIDTGAGAASVFGGGGHDQIWGGSGGPDLFVAGSGGQLEIHGFRTGTDHLSAAGQQVVARASLGGGTLFTLSSGATVLLAGVEAQSGEAQNGEAQSGAFS